MIYAPGEEELEPCRRRVYEACALCDDIEEMGRGRYGCANDWHHAVAKLRGARDTDAAARPTSSLPNVMSYPWHIFCHATESSAPPLPHCYALSPTCSTPSTRGQHYRASTHPCCQLKEPRAGSGVVRIDPLRFLAGCRTRRLNQVQFLFYILACVIIMVLL